MKKDLTYAEFNKMCLDAGISSNDKEMEQDYRNGMVMADLVDTLMDLLESNPDRDTPSNDLDALAEAAKMLDMYADGCPEQRKSALEVAARAVRFAADHCHDEQSGN